VIIDEAAIVRGLLDAWNFVIRSTLVDYAGDAWFLSTPKGRNGFYQLWTLGQDPLNPDWQSWQMPTAANPYIDAGEIETLRQSLPERVFCQEILAEFLEDAGGVFRHVMECANAVERTDGQPGHRYVVGVDWGKLNDFTVFSVMDVAERALVVLERFNQIDYTVQIARLQALCERFRPNALVVERNSIGEPLIEVLVRLGLPVVAFQTTNASKMSIMDELSLAFERREVHILNDPTLINELQAYEMERLPSGMLRYNAPEGMHDDCVMSLALAWSAVHSPSGWTRGSA
jgi:hypothetical protein